MELKNANPMVVNKLHLMFLFFQKILKVELNKGLQTVQIP